MKNTLYNGYEGPRMPKEMQLKRIRRAIAQELTASQREILLPYHVQGMNIPQIAAERGVYKSTVSRTLKRAEDKLRRYLKY
jgi:RNA polymerase sigma factor (sigma-70 family)